MTRIAVAIVHYRSEELLAECLGCLCASTLTDFRAAVVDNGSDRPLRGLDDDRIVELKAGANLGYAAGVNLALTALPADAPYVLLLNPDVQLAPAALGDLVTALEAAPEVGAASCALRLPDGRLDPACRRSEPTAFSALSKQLGLQRLFPDSPRLGRYNLTGVDPTAPHDIDSGTGAMLLVRREALDAAGGRLDDRFFLYGEDLDLCRGIRRAGYRVRYWPDARALHVKGSGRIRSPRVTARFYHAMWLYYRKWGHHRRNPAVLAGLASGLLVLGTAELLRNFVRRRLFGRERP